MDKIKARIIVAYARCSMNITNAASKANYSRNGFLWHLDKIKSITGLDPRNFFDLHELYSIACNILGDEANEI